VEAGGLTSRESVATVGPEQPPLVPSVIRWTRASHQQVMERLAVAANEQLIADIMGAQQRLQRLFAYDRSNPLFSSHLTLSQLRILMLLSRSKGMSGSELAEELGVGLAALSGMVDRLVTNDLVIRQEDPHDRRVRRISLSRAGSDLIGGIITAGAEKERRLLSRLTAEELTGLSASMNLLAKVAQEMVDEISGQVESPGRG
jgi:DNA-binding MarR family transcriptional regulator